MSGGRNTPYVFLYGTLKTGQPNHHYLGDICGGKAKLIGLAQTVEKYPLVIATQHNCPFMLGAKGAGNVVKGELIEVDDKVLETLDKVECHPIFYTREKIQVVLVNDPLSHVDCWVYLLNDFKPQLMDGDMFSEYDSNGNHGLKFVERSHPTKEDLDNPKNVLAQVKNTIK